MRRKILLAFDDPGGGLAVSTLIDKLIERNYIDLEVYAGLLSEKFLAEKTIEFKKINSLISIEEAEEIINNVSPDILITGTSGGNAEQQLRNVAFNRNIKSVVIMDFWKDYGRRWLYASYQLETLKEKICVIDEMMKTEMIEEGFPKDNLIITGHPYLDKIFNYKINLENEDTSGKNNFLFLSQPLHTIGIKNYKIHPFKIFLDAIKELSEIREENILLTVKLHPLESLLSELRSLINEYNGEKLEVKFANEKTQLTELILKSKVVIGYNTIAMFEAKALNKRTISLNVVPVKKSLTKAMERAGIEIIDATKESIFDCLQKKSNSRLSSEVFKGGIENCVKIIFNELNLN